MKSSFAIVAVLLAAGTVMAQTSPTANQTGGASGQAQGQSSSKPATPSGAQTQPSSGAKKLPEAKTQEEYKAYQEAAAKTDPAEMAAAAEAFALKFPNSELREILYVQAMNLYQRSDNAEREIAMGRKAIALDPTDPQPLIHVASALAETTRDTDLDRQDRLNEAAKDAQAAIDNIDTGLHIPPNAPPDRVAAVKASIVAMGYETLGVIYINQKDYAAAEQNLLKAVDAHKASPDAGVYLRLSVAQDNLAKYPQALESANKAVQLAQPGTVVQSLAKQQQARLQKLIAAGSPSSPAAPPATAPAPAKPAPTQPSSTTPPTTPH
jgi:tetratricopeptide (TPR) repeat protein